MIACVIRGAKKLTIENRPEPRPPEGEVLIRFGAGGICGSDLHYYQEGRVGDFAVREPMVLGHEVAGEVVAVGPNVTKIQPGQRVAVNPTRACRLCYYCLSLENCIDATRPGGRIVQVGRAHPFGDRQRFVE